MFGVRPRAYDQRGAWAHAQRTVLKALRSSGGREAALAGVLATAVYANPVSRVRDIQLRGATPSPLEAPPSSALVPYTPTKSPRDYTLAPTQSAKKVKTAPRRTFRRAVAPVRFRSYRRAPYRKHTYRRAPYRRTRLGPHVYVKSAVGF